MIKELTIENTSLPEGWCSEKLDTLCDVEYGTRVVRKRDGGTIYPVYGGGGATFFMDTFNREDCLVVARFAVSEKCTRFVNGKFFLNDSGLSVKPKDTDIVSQEFLNKYFIFLNDYIYSLARGAAQKNLNVPAFRKIEILYPESLTKQKQIVAILDKAFAAIDTVKANAEQNLQNAKELFESYLQNMFEKIKANGQLYSLANYLDLITYGFTNPMPTTDEGPYKVTAKDVKYGIVNYKTARRTSQDAFDNLIRDKCKPKKGDVLLTKDGTLGRLAVVENANMCINQSVAVLRPTKELDSYYLKELLSSKFYQELMIEQAGGATIKHIYITRVDKMLVPVPSITEQLAIIKKLDALSSETKKLEAIYTQKLDDLEEMKKSVLQKAFSGQLNSIN